MNWLRLFNHRSLLVKIIGVLDDNVLHCFNRFSFLLVVFHHLYQRLLWIAQLASFNQLGHDPEIIQQAIVLSLHHLPHPQVHCSCCYFHRFHFLSQLQHFRVIPRLTYNG